MLLMCICHNTLESTLQHPDLACLPTATVRQTHSAGLGCVARHNLPASALPATATYLPICPTTSQPACKSFLEAQ